MIVSNQSTFNYNIYNNYSCNKPQNKAIAQHNGVNFTSNPNSKLLKLYPKDFFINIKGYGKDMKWAEKVAKLTDNAVTKIRENNSSDEVLKFIADGMKKANEKVGDDNLGSHTGVLRVARKDFGPTGTWADIGLETPFGKSAGYVKYRTYSDRFAKASETEMEKPYPDIDITDIYYSPVGKKGVMAHGRAKNINNALDHVSDTYNELQKNYIQHPENVTDKTLTDIHSKVGEIRWILAHATPWERGSDSIANSFMRALYKSMGIKAPTSKRGVSFDLQAYCTGYKQYEKDFPTYFSKPPEVIND